MEDVTNLSFEQARDQLREVIQVLEAGSAPLEETLKLWEKGEALATHCRGILETALAHVNTAAETPASDIVD